jgi:hypothetical protein
MKNEFVWTLEGYIRQYRMLAGVEGGDAFKAESLKGGSSYGRKNCEARTEIRQCVNLLIMVSATVKYIKGDHSLAIELAYSLTEITLGI